MMLMAFWTVSALSCLTFNRTMSLSVVLSYGYSVNPLLISKGTKYLAQYLIRPWEKPRQRPTLSPMSSAEWRFRLQPMTKLGWEWMPDYFQPVPYWLMDSPHGPHGGWWWIHLQTGRSLLVSVAVAVAEPRSLPMEYTYLKNNSPLLVLSLTFSLFLL